MVRPLRTFLLIAAAIFLVGLFGVVRFLYFYVQTPENSGHVQSLVVGVGLIICSLVIALLAVLGDLLAANRRLLEDLRARIRRVETASSGSASLPGVESTGHAPWNADSPRGGGP